MQESRYLLITTLPVSIDDLVWKRAKRMRGWKRVLRHNAQLHLSSVFLRCDSDIILMFVYLHCGTTMMVLEKGTCLLEWDLKRGKTPACWSAFGNLG